jgi:hypothetical protein
MMRQAVLWGNAVGPGLEIGDSGLARATCALLPGSIVLSGGVGGAQAVWLVRRLRRLRLFQSLWRY